jgi:hypothetical protein
MSDEFKNGVPQKPASLSQLIDGIDEAIYQRLKTAVELGKWEDGSRLSQQQLESCMQAIILYEAKNLPEDQRTGMDLSASCASKSINSETATNDAELPLNFTDNFSDTNKEVH